MLRVKKFAFILLLIAGLSDVFAQDACVNYDSRYPITTSTGKVYEWNPVWNFPSMRQHKVTGINIGNLYKFKGLLEYFPAGYDANSAVKHPVIIYFHGNASKGEGTTEHLCRLFKDRGGDSATHKAIPGMIENHPELFDNQNFIVISPQFTVYERAYEPDSPPTNYPSAREVDSVIQYVKRVYKNKINPQKIYLTGYSSGANMIMEYVGSSLARAKSVAAVMPISLCSQYGHFSNAGIDPAYIGEAKLPTWFVYCQSDACGDNIPLAWIDRIKTVAGHTPPRLTALSDNGLAPSGMYQCSDTLDHDAWSRGYDPLFTQSFINSGTSTQPSDGVNINMYQWFSLQTSAILPVALKSFSAQLAGDKVELKWITIDEKNNASFTIERSGADQQYIAIGTIPASTAPSVEKVYSFIDNDPLPDLSFYRLVQTDTDGKKTYLEIKKIVNRKENKNAVIVSPNPFNSEISAFISVDKSQKVVIHLSDITGKILKTITGTYSQGTAETTINAHDLAKGIYLLKVKGENFAHLQKIVKK